MSCLRGENYDRGARRVQEKAVNWYKKIRACARHDSSSSIARQLLLSLSLSLSLETHSQPRPNLVPSVVI